MSNLKELDKTYVANTYARFPLQIVSGKGAIAYDENGKKYIDMGTGIGVTAFGYADDEWAEAVNTQIHTLQHTSNLYYTEPCVKLAEMLCTRTGMKKVFFGNSGAEANECAIKVARKWAADNKGAEYYNIVTLEGSFHGRTLTTLAATGQDHYHELFQPITPGFLYVKPEDLEGMKKTLSENKCAGVLIECVQGEGGVLNMSKEFIQGVAKLCEEYNVLLMVDEVQTGNGRTGKLYSYMHFGIKPDVISTAKGIGGGLPLGCCIIGEKAEFALGFGDHGSTFGGNPVCCAGAVSIIGRMTDAFLADVEAKAAKARAAFEGAKGIEAVSGLGMMFGIKTSKPAGEVVSKCMEKGVLCLTAKDKVRLLPPLNIPEETLMEAVEIIKAVCAE